MPLCIVKDRLEHPEHRVVFYRDPRSCFDFVRTRNMELANEQGTEPRLSGKPLLQLINQHLGCNIKGAPEDK